VLTPWIKTHLKTPKFCPAPKGTPQGPKRPCRDKFLYILPNTLFICVSI
jgi:hypothetical protein